MESVHTGENYAKDIVKAIQSCSCMVLLYSDAAADSVHVQKELDLALKYRKKIYPLRIENIEPKEAMEYFLSGSQYSDIFEDFDVSMQKFVEYLRLELGLEEDFTKKLSTQSIEKFCSKHFHAMGYEISKPHKAEWKSLREVQNALLSYPKGEEEILRYLQNNCILAQKEGKKLIIHATFLEQSSLPYLKAHEADLFWQARKLIWKKEALKGALGFFGYEESVIEKEDIDFKLKSNIVNKLRTNRDNANLKILYYLYIKNPPKYSKQKYDIPLNGVYAEQEEMPHLYLNYSYVPKWWGHGKDDIENIPGNLYRGFSSSFDAVRFEKHTSTNNATYENYDGRVAETLAEVFLKRNALVVQKFGAEAILGNALSFMQKSSFLENSKAGKTIKKFMTSPDILAIKLNEQNEIVDAYMMDVKFRSYETKEDFAKALHKEGELYAQAKKYHHNWEDIYLFLFAYLKESKKLEIFLISIADLLQGDSSFSKIEEDPSFGWLSAQEIELLYKKASTFWVE